MDKKTTAVGRAHCCEGQRVEPNAMKGLQGKPELNYQYLETASDALFRDLQDWMKESIPWPPDLARAHALIRAEIQVRKEEAKS